MKLLVAQSLVVMASLSSVPLLAADPVEINAPVGKIYVPKGFDDNDNVEIILAGKFKSSCFKTAQATAQVNQLERVISVTATALQYDGLCAEVLVPFIQVVNVGRLDRGDYTVKLTSNEQVSELINVGARTTESPDDFLYAPVEEANLRQDLSSRRQTIRLAGTYPYCFIGCMKIREVRVAKNASNMLVVQPISEIVDTPECEDRKGDQSFEMTVPLNEPIVGEGLLHVRVLNGTSLNRYVDFH